MRPLFLDSWQTDSDPAVRPHFGLIQASSLRPVNGPHQLRNRDAGLRFDTTRLCRTMESLLLTSSLSERLPDAYQIAV